MKKPSKSKNLFQHHVSPRLEEVKIYFLQKGIPEREAEDFFHVYENRHWTSKKGNFYRNWKTIAYRWVASVWKSNPLLFDKTA
jgi:hypothetical protein